MTKKKKSTILESSKDLEITSASIKDDFCNYSFEILKGTGAGDTHSVKGKGIIDTDLHNAFADLSVHLAYVDDAFKTADIEVSEIDSVKNHSLTFNYFVMGIRAKGEGEALTIVIIGEKYISNASGRMLLTTPKIALDKLSSYPFAAELRTALEKIREEVILYKEGKYTMIEEPAEADPNQLTIGDAMFDEAKI